MQKIMYTIVLLVSLKSIGQTQESHPLQIDKSIIEWRGTYAFLFSEHSGTVSFKSGHLETENKHITGGSFLIDMRSITNPDFLLNQGPVKHLRGEDFFDIEKYPEAHLKITNVTYFEEENKHKMEGRLTIKGVTKSIEFWSDVDGEKRLLNTRFKIDRRRWGILYNNELKNHAIADAIEFEVELYF